MPMLPPRNLPFSPTGSPHTPTSKRGDDRASPSPSNAGTPSKKRDVSGILPRQDETTFHRKLRTLLWDHCRACERWEDVVSTQAAKSVASISRLSAALDDLLVKRPYKEEKDRDIAVILRSSKVQAENKAMDEMAVLLKGLDVETAELQECMSKIVKAASKLEGLSEAAEGLLVEATRAKGSDFTFDQEMWLTWSMDRYVGSVQLITSRHLLQTEHLHCLSKLLLEEGCAPGRASRSSEVDTRGRKDEEDEDDVESEEENEEIDDVGKQKRKRRALIRERVLEEWQALNLLKDERTGIDAGWFEGICEVEVGRWGEQ